MCGATGTLWNLMITVEGVRFEIPLRYCSIR